MPDFIQVGAKVWDARAGDAVSVVSIDQKEVLVEWGIGRSTTHYKNLLPTEPPPSPKLPWSTPVLEDVANTPEGRPLWIACQALVTKGDFG